MSEQANEPTNETIDIEQLKKDSLRYRRIRFMSQIKPKWKGQTKRYVIDLPTIGAYPTNEGLSFRDNFDRSVDEYLDSLPWENFREEIRKQRVSK